MSAAASPQYEDADFDWIQLSNELAPYQPGFWAKTTSKFKENPFVPIGAFGAVGALSYGLYSMVKGNQMQSQYAMRARIGSQAFAIAALIIGYLTAKEPPSKKRQERLDIQKQMKLNAVTK